jgi:hypothetical protein
MSSEGGKRKKGGGKSSRRGSKPAGGGKATAMIGTPSELAGKKPASEPSSSADPAKDDEAVEESHEVSLPSRPGRTSTRQGTLIVEDPESEDRPALLLPSELSAEETAIRSQRRQSATPPRGGKTKSHGSLPGGEGSDRFSVPQRMSRVSRLSMWAGVGQRTTLVEIAGVTDVLVRVTQVKIPLRGLRFQLAVSAVVGVFLVLMVTVSLSLGNWRWIPLGMLFLFVTALLTYATLRQVPRLARRFGELSLPGRAGMWVGIGLSALASTGALVTWGVEQAGIRVGRIVLPAIAPYVPVPLPAATGDPEKPVAIAAASHGISKRWEGHLWVSPGVLFMPPSFHSDDGYFDLVLHFHGNTELVKDSIGEAGMNVLVHISNLGLGSHPYQDRFAMAGRLEALLGKIEEKASDKLGRPMKVRRIALMSWSAGYGALLSLLNQPKVFERVDAVLVADGIHSGFVPGGGRAVEPAGIAPFVRYAKEAVAGRRLMVITHSEISTYEYSSSSESADAILAALGLTRTKLTDADSPPEVTFESAVTAFPARERRWLSARSAAHAGNFHLYGYAGRDKPDHIAHLAQIAVTLLPELKKRWATVPEGLPEPLPAEEPSGAPPSTAAPRSTAAPPATAAPTAPTAAPTPTAAPAPTVTDR